MSEVESSSCPSILSIPDDESDDEIEEIEDEDEMDDEHTQDALFTVQTNDLFRHLSEQKSEATLTIPDALEAEFERLSIYTIESEEYEMSELEIRQTNEFYRKLALAKS